MLSLKNITAGGACKYYESAAGEYYDKDSKTTEWQGRIASELGLAGQRVDFKDFENLAYGRGLAGEKLVKGAGSEKHLAGFDFTFSAPKSVSILAMNDSAILEAHREAVTNTLKHLEENYIQTRVMKDGEKKIVDTGKIIVAKFEHHTNRNQEPQVHTHCAVMNVTMDLEGRYKTIHNKVFYHNQKEIGQLYRLELARVLIKNGYAIEITDQTQGFFKIKGVSDEMIKAFSTRTAEVNWHFWILWTKSIYQRLFPVICNQ
ncbi:MAG: relaxase domain-containing protein [Oligoflexia bacterium]|nr:relaxase domain-containing protein [Oligoflexia bacterium]